MSLDPVLPSRIKRLEVLSIVNKACKFISEEEDMNGKQAGKLDGMYTKRNGELCGHQRLVDDQYEQGQKTGRLVCRECGAVLQDWVNASHARG
jgi:hypothetical protein